MTDLLVETLLRGMPCNHEHGGQSSHAPCETLRRQQAARLAATLRDVVTERES